MSKNPVVDLSDPLAVTVLSAIQGAIESAYIETRTQTADHDPRLQQTLFGQVLYHNVSQQVHASCSNLPDVASDLRPNSTRSTYHVAVAVNEILITIHAVPKRDRRPKKSKYTTRLNFIQPYFTINAAGAFEIAPLPNPHHPDTSYVQILHGPHTHDRRSLGFTLIAILDHSDHYLANTIDLEQHIADHWPQSDDIENIQDQINLPIIVPTGVPYYETR